MRPLLALACGLALAACESPTVSLDSGEPPDAGAADAGPVDAGPLDAGPVDAGPLDAGPPDAGPGDGGGGDCSAGLSPASDVVLTERGPVRGVVADGGRAFRGIPHLKPPVGALRWRPPEDERACFPAVFEARDFGPVCPQLAQQQGQPFDAGLPVLGSEDCLTVNVFTPADATPDAGLPVLVFIHGGGNTLGSTSETTASGVRLYDGVELAREGRVVVVTPQYRLGVLGFLTTPVLDDADGGVQTNFGLQDQQAALRWVQRNIRAFGGDPSRVLLFGESAGAVNTCTHLVMPGSRGLFSSALMQSGTCNAAATLASSRVEALVWVQGTGCLGMADVAGCLRGRTPEQLIRAYPVPVVVGQRGGAVSWGPVVDGLTLPGVPLTLIQEGRHHQVPVVVGSNLDETFLSMPNVTTEAEYRAFVATQVGAANVEAVVSRYPVATHGTPRRALVQATTDAFFGCQARRAARALARAQPTVPVYRYLFARQPLGLGASHGVELLHVFQQVREVLRVPPPGDVAVEAQLREAWTELAARGTPNPPGSSAWPRYEAAEVLRRIDDPPGTEPGWRNAECDYWDAFSNLSVPPPP